MQRSKLPPVYLAVIQLIPLAKIIVMAGDNTAIRREGLEASLDKLARQKDILLEKLLELSLIHI